ncbi:MAG: hypothetical protein K0R38_339 [Polyangiaceae bacterium]|nr:hypothetical protein [Polyangiaceae bacterium]
MKPQVYLPVHCSSCLGAALLPAASGERLWCPRCGAAATVLPGESYGDADTPLFERLAVTVQSELHTARVAKNVMAELRDARGRSEALGAILLRITDDLPGLRFLLPPLYLKGTTSAQHLLMTRAVGMLLTLVGARLRSLEAGSADGGGLRAKHA